MRYEILEIIKKEFYVFMRKNPNWYDGVDWNNVFSSFRFHLQANRAAIEIERHLTAAKREKVDQCTCYTEAYNASTGGCPVHGIKKEGP